MKTEIEETKLYYFDLEFDENVVEFSSNLILSVLDCLDADIKFVEFYNSLNTIEDLEELGVSNTYAGNPLKSYLQFLSGENIILDPVVTRYGIPLELGYTYLFEGITWLMPTIVYKFDYQIVKEKVIEADLFYLKTPNNPELNPYSPRFFSNFNKKTPKIWIENETLLLDLSLNEKLEIELATDVQLMQVNDAVDFFSSPETNLVSIQFGVNN